MGGGSWTLGDYTSRLASKKAAGVDIFDHDAYVRSTGDYTVHESLDPKWVAGPASPNAGKTIREAFDSDDHPESLPIAVIFDITGSMGGIPRVLQQKLPQLHGLLMRKGYVDHPQLLFGAVGDATCDRAPLQIGQFEADNRGDEQLEKLILEGGGGGGNHESYQLAAYFMARHTELDSLKKRGKKGYLFLIGDERVYDAVDRRQVEALTGDKLQENISTRDIFEELKTKFEVFFLFAAQGSYEPGDTLDSSSASGYYDGGRGVCYWRDLLGQNAIILEDADAVCETIALTLGLMEGVVGLAEGEADLLALGADPAAAKAAGKALATVSGGRGAIVVAEGDLPDIDDGDGAERL